MTDPKTDDNMRVASSTWGKVMKIEVSTTVKGPPDQVFALVSQWDLFLDKIDPDVKSITRVTDGPVGVGTRYREVLKPGPVAMTMHVDFTEFDAPNRLAFSGRGPGARVSGDITVTPKNGSSDFRIRLDLRPVGLGWLLYPMLRLDFPRRERRRLSRLTEMVETGAIALPQPG